MDMIWLAPEWLFTGGALSKNCALHVEDRQVVEIVDRSSLDAQVDLLPVAGIVTPGLIDLQVNGGGGVLFNAAPTRAGLEAIIAAHRSFGTAWILPTLISDCEAVLEQAVDAVIDAWGLAGLAGIHIEGPHISPTKRGTHSPDVLRPLGDHTLALVYKLRDRGIPTMITLAPEIVAPQQIAQLAQSGALVSLGHSDASYAQTCAALEAGATCFTHLFNAMSQLTSREPGMIGAALRSSAYAGFICDGHHVSHSTLAVALSAGNAKQRMFLVSDAMPTVGGPESFDLYGMRIRLRDGKLVNQEGNLAGAHITMAASMARAARALDLTTEEVLRMGISLPAAVIGSAHYSQVLGQGLGALLHWDNDLKACQWLPQSTGFPANKF